MTEVKIGEKTIPLFYSAYEMTAIQKEIGCTAFELREKVFGIRQTDEDDPDSIVLDVVTDPEKLEKLGTLIRILGNAGLEEKGEEGTLTDKWVMRHMKPAMIIAYAIAAMAEINEGNRMESPDMEGDQGPVDEVLEEQNAKKQPGN